MRSNNGTLLGAAVAAAFASSPTSPTRELNIATHYRHPPKKKRQATLGFTVQGDVFNQPKSKRAKRRNKHKRK